VALRVETPHHGAALAIHFVHCTPQGSACGPVEHAAANHLVFPLRGVFVKHEGRGERLVADPCHALFFEAGAPYRVSHPVEGGDECLALEPSPELLSEAPPRARCAPLDARLIAARQLLRHRLGRRLASPLEAEETALGLFLGVRRAHSPSACAPRRARLRHAEMVETTKVTLAARPGDRWTLGELAQRVYSSPWHLARVFRELAGLPLHRYHLRARLAAALREVLDTSRDLTAIGLDLGFASHSHFTASFRRTFGVTPSALRKSKILTAREAPAP
jgi:AraC family transcriptional regulator